MKRRIVIINFSCILVFASALSLGGQTIRDVVLKPVGVGNCVHGGGIPYLLDAYLASIGACNCQKEAAFLYSFPSCGKEPYEIEFEDDFTGNTLDTSKWEIQNYAQGATLVGQNIEYNSLDNAEISDGICHLTAKKEKVLRRLVYWKDSSEILFDGLPNLREYNYTSSNLWTKRKFFHGKYEIRCRMPQGHGFWPAFWMFGGKRWNEIDVFDNYDGINKFVTSIGHDYENNGTASGCNASYSGYDFSQWHTFTCIFDFDKISILIDGHLVRLIHRIITLSGEPVNCGDNIGTGTYYFLKSYPIEKMAIIINLALISENGPGASVPVDGTTPFPSSFDIDYVRMWKRNPEIDSISIQPNPTANKITVNSNHKITLIQIINMNGEIVSENKLYANYFVADLINFPIGIYFVKVNLVEGFKTFKVVKVEN